MTARRWCAAAAAMLLFVPCTVEVVRAGEGEDIDDALRSAHALVQAERWAEGEAALRRIFARNEGDPRVRVHLRQIEDDLQICLFRRSAPAPDAATILGPALRRLVPSTLEVELEYAGTDGPEWVREVGDVAYFRLRFDGDASIEFTPLLDRPSDAARLAVFGLFDPERASGYVVVPYVPWSDPAYEASGMSMAISLTPSGADVVASRSYGADARPGERILLSRIGGALALRRGSQIVFAVSHGRRRSGYVGVMGAAVKDVRLRGRLEAASYQRLVADRLAEDFRRWRSERYDRTREIPAWARISPRADADDVLGMLPLDGRFLSSEQTGEVVRLVLGGDPAGIVWGEGIAPLSEPVTSGYFRGLVAYARGEWSRAVVAFDAVLASEEPFVPARLFRGMALARMRKRDAARADLEAVVAARPRALRAYVALAEMALDDNEFDRALAYLSEAASKGGYEPELEELSHWVHRARAGPLWPRRFRAETRGFVIESDVSEAKCAEVGALLEGMQSAYASALGSAPPSPAKARVYVFASEDGYRRHTAELSMHLESTAGAYSDLLRTLFVFVPDSPDGLRSTVRHEGFHQYLSRVVPDAPDWLNEGWAQAMQGDGGSEASDLVLRTFFASRFVPVRRLVALDHEEFLRSADVHYLQSRRLVEMLLKTRDPRLAGILRDYLAALRSGASRQEVNDKVLAPVMDDLEAAFRVWLR